MNKIRPIIKLKEIITFYKTVVKLTNLCAIPLPNRSFSSPFGVKEVSVNDRFQSSGLRPL